MKWSTYHLVKFGTLHRLLSPFLQKRSLSVMLDISVLQCNPDIRELSGPENKYLISGFGLFYLGNTGCNLGPDKKSLLYPGYTASENWGQDIKKIPCFGGL